MVQALAKTRTPRARGRTDGVTRGPEQLDGSQFSGASRRRLSAPGLRTFGAIADRWGLNEEQRRSLLGMPARSTFHNWMRTARDHRDLTLDIDTLSRISAVLGIYQALGVLHGTEEERVAWLKQPHGGAVFGGKSPLELMTRGLLDELLTVRRFLDAARGGLYMEPNEVDRDFKPYTREDIVFS